MGSGILRMVKLKMHAATDKAHLQHRATPCRTCNGDRNGTRTELRVSRNESLLPPRNTAL